MILGNLHSATISWNNFINNGLVLETTGQIYDNRPATFRINNIVSDTNFDSYDASSKVFGMVKYENEVKNSLGTNFVCYQNGVDWYDPEDITDPNNPDNPNPPGPINPDDPNINPTDDTSPDNINSKIVNGVILPIAGVVGFAGVIGAGATIYTKKRRNATAHVKK
jgi:hypothetical protein